LRKHSDNTEKNVYALYLKIESNIDGKVQIELNNGGNFNRTLILDNNDKYVYGADSY